MPVLNKLGPNTVLPLADVYTKEVTKEIKELMKHYSATGESNSGWEEMKLVLLKHGLAWYEDLLPTQVGTSPFNRKGLGVQGVDAQVHGEQVHTVGFVRRLAEETSVGVQKNPHDDWEIKWNEDQQSRSKGLIPKLAPVVLCFSIGTSHTTVWVRMLISGVRAAVKSLADESGNLDVQRITGGKPALKDAMTKGWKWFVVHFQLEQAVPGILDWIQTNLNIKAAAERGEVEVMSSMWQQAITMDPLDWKVVQATQNKTLAPCTRYTPALANWLQVHTGTLLTEMPNFLKAFEREGEVPVLGGEFLGQMAEIKHGDEKVPYLAIAGLKAAILSPKVVDGMSKSIPLSKLKSLKSASKKEEVFTADKILQQGREIGVRMGVSENPGYARCLGFLDIRIWALICDLPKVWESKTWATMGEVSEEHSL